MSYDVRTEPINQTFCAVSHTAVEALADLWKTRNIAWYLAHCQAFRLLPSGSVQEVGREAHISRCSEAGAAADVRDANPAKTRGRSTVNGFEASDVMFAEVFSDRAPKRSRKTKKNSQDRMLSLGPEKLLKPSVPEVPLVTKDGAMQQEDTVKKALTRARESTYSFQYPGFS